MVLCCKNKLQRSSSYRSYISVPNVQEIVTGDIIHWFFQQVHAAWIWCRGTGVHVIKVPTISIFLYSNVVVNLGPFPPLRFLNCESHFVEEKNQASGVEFKWGLDTGYSSHLMIYHSMFCRMRDLYYQHLFIIVLFE